MDIKSIFLKCIKYEINREAVPLIDEELSEEQLAELYQLTRSHDLTHIIAKTLKAENKLVNQQLEKAFTSSLHVALFCDEQKRFVKTQIAKVFEEVKIAHVLLKGAVLSNYYPESWMRNSCDLDVLVRLEDLEEASNILIQKLGYTLGKRSSHDITLFATNGIIVELHYDLIEVMPRVDNILSKVWEDVILEENSEANYIMPDELFYFYHIAHMAKHFAHGGCGIRSFIDVWILNHKVSFDKKKRRKLLEKGNLLIFAESVEALSEVWFGEKEHEHITLAIEEFIFDGGVYGSLENRVLMQRSQSKNGLHFLLKRVFMPYKEMCFEYPTLKEKAFLLPVYWVVRWFRWLCSDRVRKAIKELVINGSVTKSNQDRINELVNTLDIDVLNG